jgi:hypothetical protein
MFSPFKVGFRPTEKEKSDGAISGIYGGCSVRLNRETSNVFEVELPYEPLHCPDAQSHGFASFFGIWMHFLSEWTQHFFTKEWRI